ncbi:hypothetical protein B0H34DRAFT_681375 [Crassisporium funariophilum]|nr:hypothetical protein B0H34DRAFT_681375 [Crassisporium funariophilum]
MDFDFFSFSVFFCALFSMFLFSFFLRGFSHSRNAYIQYLSIKLYITPRIPHHTSRIPLPHPTSTTTQPPIPHSSHHQSRRNGADPVRPCKAFKTMYSYLLLTTDLPPQRPHPNYLLLLYHRDLMFCFSVIDTYGFSK